MACGGCAKKNSILQKAKNLGGAVAQMAKGETISVSDEVYKERLKTCSHCDDLKRYNPLPKGADIGLLDSCGLCGCLVRQKAKRQAVAGVERDYWDCPARKWAYDENLSE